MSKKVLVNLLVVATLTIAGVVGVAAYQSTQAAAPVLSGVAGGLAHDGVERGPGGPGGASDEALAEALGITVDELTAAYQSATAEALKQAVEQGLITQAQADQITAGGRGLPFGGRGGWLADSDIDFDALLADALGITTDELQAARQAANDARLEQAVTDGQLTQEQVDLMKGQQALFADQTFLDAMQATYQAAVQDAVERGVITQAQADLILANSANAKGFPGMPGMEMPGMGGPGGRHGGRGGFDRGAPGLPPADAPASPADAPTTGG